MDEKKRTKLLGGLLAAVIAVYGGRSLFRSTFLEPITSAENKVETTQKTLESLTLKEIQLGAARRNLQDWRDISLPEDPLTSQRLYREWIENLALKCGFLLESVEPGGKNDVKGRFQTVSVELRGETDLAGLSRFMFLFDQAALLHRISSLKIDSTGSQGNPRLEVALTAEGMSVFSSGERNELFTRTSATSDISESAADLAVGNAQAFPKTTPFLVRIDRELLKVTAMDGSAWKVERGVVGTKAVSHAAGAVVELLPVQWDRREKSFEQYTRLLSASPFALPAPPKTWAPKVTGLSDKTIKPGEEVRLTVKADGFNPELGEPRFTLVEKADGMELNETTGEFLWKAPADLAAGKYTAKIAMAQTARPETRVEAQLELTVSIPNAAPQLESADSAIVIIGQEFVFPVKATDDGPADKLTFSVGGGSPNGLSIDARTGEIRWTAPLTFRPGQYEVEVKVTDAGATAQSASKRIKLDVQDDAAMLTLLTGAVSRDAVWYAWFRNRGTGESKELKIGDRLKVSEIDAEIVAIENRYILLRDSAGTWKLALGDSVRQRVQVTPAATDATPVPTAAAVPVPPSLPGKVTMPPTPDSANRSQPPGSQSSGSGG